MNLKKTVRDRVNFLRSCRSELVAPKMDRRRIPERDERYIELSARIEELEWVVGLIVKEHES